MITGFEGKGDFQNHPFGWVRFENLFFNYKITTTKNVCEFYRKLISLLGTG